MQLNCNTSRLFRVDDRFLQNSYEIDKILN
ncbi:hypothetical protein N007_01890 [Alicyclobacillus acidoterrestris ATCC 49025]|nr:hypothetical protein N007_01890 [Alicyclobacillus acidoterrestris ATCC 49025]